MHATEEMLRRHAAHVGILVLRHDLRRRYIAIAFPAEALGDDARYDQQEDDGECYREGDEHYIAHSKMVF